MHSSHAGRSETLRKACGALAGTLTVSPARATEGAPRNVTSASPSSTRNISSKSWRCGGAAARRDVHVNEGVTAGGVIAHHQYRVSVSHHREMAQVLVVGPREQEIPSAVVGRNRRGGLRRGARILVHLFGPFTG